MATKDILKVCFGVLMALIVMAALVFGGVILGSRFTVVDKTTSQPILGVNVGEPTNAVSSAVKATDGFDLQVFHNGKLFFEDKNIQEWYMPQELIDAIRNGDKISMSVIAYEKTYLNDAGQNPAVTLQDKESTLYDSKNAGASTGTRLVTRSTSLTYDFDNVWRPEN